jgi:hypothetical protein
MNFQCLLAVAAGTSSLGITTMPPDVGVQELADRVEVAAQRRFVTATSQLDIALHHAAIFARDAYPAIRFK